MINKEVNFQYYCPRCLYSEVKETDLPCDECLESGGNEDSHKPINFKEKK